jgi:hypothetical protein
MKQSESHAWEMREKGERNEMKTDSAFPGEMNIGRKGNMSLTHRNERETSQMSADSTLLETIA